MTPAHLAGPWERVSVAVGDAPAAERASVVWLQVGDVYADLRIPRDTTGSAASFAGTTSWQDPFLHWAHDLDLDLDPSGGTDVGHLRFDGDDLVETGAFDGPDGPIAYTEVWRRLPGGAGPRLAMTRDDGRGVLVRTGDHALTVVDDRPAGGAFCATYRTLSGSGSGTGLGRSAPDRPWTITQALGSGAEELPEPPAPGDGPGDHVAGLEGWHVVRTTAQLCR